MQATLFDIFRMPFSIIARFCSRRAKKRQEGAPPRPPPRPPPPPQLLLLSVDDNEADRLEAGVVCADSPRVVSFSEPQLPLQVSTHSSASTAESAPDSTLLDPDTDLFSRELFEAFKRRKLWARMEQFSVRGVGRNAAYTDELRAPTKAEFQKWYLIGQGRGGTETSASTLCLPRD